MNPTQPVMLRSYARRVPEEVVLRTKQLVKRFGSITAVDGLDVEVGRGEVVGLLGPNGAGKSTTIGMVLGLITPTAGTAEVLGRDIRVRREDALAGVGAMLEVTSFYPYLSGRDNLAAVALLRGAGALARVDPLLAWLGLAQRGESKFRTYSLGMRQRLGIAAKLRADPKRGAEINRALASAALYASAIVPRASSLEDVFMELTEPEASTAPPPS